MQIGEKTCHGKVLYRMPTLNLFMAIMHTRKLFLPFCHAIRTMHAARKELLWNQKIKWLLPESGTMGGTDGMCRTVGSIVIGNGIGKRNDTSGQGGMSSTFWLQKQFLT